MPVILGKCECLSVVCILHVREQGYLKTCDRLIMVSVIGPICSILLYISCMLCSVVSTTIKNEKPFACYVYQNKPFYHKTVGGMRFVTPLMLNIRTQATIVNTVDLRTKFTQPG